MNEEKITPEEISQRRLDIIQLSADEYLRKYGALPKVEAWNKDLMAEASCEHLQELPANGQCRRVQ